MKPYVIDALCELASEQVIESRPALMVKGDGLAHQWRVAVVSRGEPVDLSGCSVAGYFVQNGEQTVRQPGVVSGNVAIVEIPDAVYGVSGPVDAFMRLTDATRKATISMIRMTVREGATDVIIDPANKIPSIDELLMQIERLERLEEDVSLSESIRKKAEDARNGAETARVGAEDARKLAETARGSSEDARKAAETVREGAESIRVASEDARKSAETVRESAEAARVSAEDVRKTAEAAREGAETKRADAEKVRASAEDVRKGAETGRVEAETARATSEAAREGAETGRAEAEAARASAEDERKGAEAARASAESARKTAEAARESAETKRAEAETARASAEAAREGAETKRADAEKVRASTEDARKGAESARASAESVRKTAEDARESEETKRAAAEAARVSAEDARKGEETKRAAAETARASAEAARGSAETGRRDAETARASAETARESAETGRRDAESARVSAENARKTAETGREQAEAKRVADSAKALLDAQAAVDAADGWAHAEAAARTLDVGAAASANVTTAGDGHKLLTLGLPRGERGPQGRGLTAMGLWAPGVQYLCSDAVQHFVLFEDSSYVCRQSHTSGADNAPPAAAYWTLLAAKGSVDNLPGMVGATAEAAGEAGLVPKPAAGAQGRYLRGDGTWQTPPNTTYSPATASANGLMSAADKAKLDGVAAGANNYAHPTNAGNRHVPAGGLSGQILRWSADGTAAWGADNDTTYSDMKGATAEAAGGRGLVPAPAAGAQGRYLRGDGTWQTPPNTTYSPATASANGLMSSADKAKLDGVAAGANNYAHPTNAGNRHVPAGGASGQILRWSADGTAAWGADNDTTYSDMKGATAEAAGGRGLVPAPAAGTQGKYLRGDGTWQTPPNTTYNAATQSANGLMSSVDKAKLDGVAAGANNYAHPAGDGNLHVPATGTSNNGKVLKAGSTAGALSWGVLDKASVGLGNVDNTTDVNKPISTAVQNALNGKANSSHTHTIENITSLQSTLNKKFENGNSFLKIGTLVINGITSVDKGLVCGTDNRIDSKGFENSVAIGRGNTITQSTQFLIGTEIRGATGQENFVGVGCYNNAVPARFVVGNGNSGTRTNAFRINTDGSVLANKAYQSAGADYAENFEWADGNPEDEDRVGHFVSLDGELISICAENFEPLGIISATPAIIGDTACEDWDGRFKKDIFGREIKDNDGNSVLSEDFDENQKYVSRTDRKEWGTVGLLGKLILIDDGTCEINGYVAPTSGGIGTKSTVRTKFRVMKRLDATHVKVLVL